MMFPALLCGVAAAYAFHLVKDIGHQQEMWKGIRERAGGYPNGCAPTCGIAECDWKGCECDHVYCQLLRNARKP